MLRKEADHEAPADAEPDAEAEAGADAEAEASPSPDAEDGDASQSNVQRLRRKLHRATKVHRADQPSAKKPKDDEVEAYLAKLKPATDSGADALQQKDSKTIATLQQSAASPVPAPQGILANMAPFQAGAQKLRAEWSKRLNPLQKAEPIVEAANAALASVGYSGPPLKAGIISGDAAQASFGAQSWSIGVGNLTNVSLVNQLFTSAFHETRHAEQAYLRARWQAQQGGEPDQISPDVAAAAKAAAQSMPPLSPQEAAFAQRLDQGMNPEASAVYKVIDSALQGLMAIKKSDPLKEVADPQKAEQVSAPLLSQYQTANSRANTVGRDLHGLYKLFPHEQDALAAGNAMKAFLK